MAGVTGAPMGWADREAQQGGSQDRTRRGVRGGRRAALWPQGWAGSTTYAGRHPASKVPRLVSRATWANRTWPRDMLWPQALHVSDRPGSLCPGTQLAALLANSGTSRTLSGEPLSTPGTHDAVPKPRGQRQGWADRGTHGYGDGGTGARDTGGVGGPLHGPDGAPYTVLGMCTRWAAAVSGLR